MKGQSVFLSHTLVVLFTVMLLVVIFSTLNNVRGEQSEKVGEEGAKLVCSLVRGAVDKVYGRDLVGKIEVGLPKTIGNNQYMGSFFGNSLGISFGEQNYNCTMPFSTDYQGRFSGGYVSVSYNGSEVVVT